MKKINLLSFAYCIILMNGIYASSKHPTRKIFHAPYGELFYQTKDVQTFHIPTQKIQLRSAKEYKRLGTMVVTDSPIGHWKLVIEKNLGIQNSLYIYELTIEEDHRKKGLGRLMVEEIKKTARKKDIEYITLHSLPEAINFWKKQGFSRVNIGEYANPIMCMHIGLRLRTRLKNFITKYDGLLFD